MAEITSDVYDFIHPTPVSLKELAAITISIEIWRIEVNEHRASRTLDEFYPLSQYFFNPLETIYPDLPPVIHYKIREYIPIFGNSMEKWLEDHHKAIFGLNDSYSEQNDILKDFDDFVGDFDGSIHHIRTAERMIRCERLSMEDKFTIACTYCFENDIRQIWPSVSDNMNVNWFNFFDNPQLYYWICYLTNDLDRVPIAASRNGNVDEIMFDVCVTQNRPSVEYFWDRIPSESRFQKAVDIFMRNRKSFVRFILPKLDGQLLDQFVNEKGGNLIRALLENRYYDVGVVLRTWMHIRNSTNQRIFTNIVVNILETETITFEEVEEGSEEYVDNVRCPDDWVYLCCEIWNSAPNHLKRSAIRNISLNITLFENLPDSHRFPLKSRDVSFLLSVFACATFEERSAFWHNYWHILIDGTRGKGLQQVMTQCFKNEEEIDQFKEKVMVSSEYVRRLCFSLLKWAYFAKLNDFVSFLCPKIQAARNFKQNLLQRAFLGADCQLTTEIIARPKIFNEFIDDAYDSTDSSTEFKNQLMSSSVILDRLAGYIVSISGLCRFVSLTVEGLVAFTDTFLSTEQTSPQIKKRIIDSLKEYLNVNRSNCEFAFSGSRMNSILLWCLGSDGEVEKFKSEYNSL